MSTLYHSELATSRAQIVLKAAAIVIASCDASEDEPAVLYDSGAIGQIVCIELADGDLLFETVNLRNACDAVAQVKGECHFKMLHVGVSVPPDNQWPDGGKIQEVAEIDTDEDFDDDDLANWWKRGAQ